MKTTDGSIDVNEGAKKKKKRVVAGPCPQSPRHENTRVYSTHGATSYCCCDDCGHTWKVVGQTAPGNAAAPGATLETTDEAPPQSKPAPAADVGAEDDGPRPAPPAESRSGDEVKPSRGRNGR